MTMMEKQNTTDPVKLISPDEVSFTVDWVKERYAGKRPFLIRGNGTNPIPYSHHSPLLPDEILSTRNLKQVMFFDPDDLVAGMESGITAIEIQEILGKNQMYLPVNPWFPNSTLGGLTAANIFGPNRMMMGGLRDYLIGIEYINGKGELVHSGGKVVKNVSGYDLTRMMLGSLGGMGVITSVNFKALPKPVGPHGLYTLATSAEWTEAIAFLHSSRLPIDWVQAVTCDVPERRWIIGIGYSGNAERRKRFEREIHGAFKNELISLADGEESDDLPCMPGRDRFFGFLPPILESWDMQKPGLHLLATMPTKDVLGFAYEDWQTRKPSMIVHPGGGDIHFFLESGDAEDHNLFLADLHEKTSTTGCTMRLVRCSAPVDSIKRNCPQKPSGYELALRLKNHLDPAGIFHSPFFLMN